MNFIVSEKELIRLVLDFDASNKDLDIFVKDFLKSKQPVELVAETLSNRMTYLIPENTKVYIQKVKE